MFGSGKTSQNAIAAVSYLSERYEPGGRLISSLEIARERNLPKPIVAKVLTTLSQAAIVTGAPGPSGGYRLAVAPEEVTLHDVVACFEDPGAPVMCPFGPDWCGKKDPCPMHDSIAELQSTLEEFLRSRHFGMFRAEGIPAK